MNLILQAIKSLFRKIENRNSQTTSALSKRIGAAQTAAENAQTAAENAQTAADNAQTAAENAQAAADNNTSNRPLLVRFYEEDSYLCATHKPKQIKEALAAGRVVMMYDGYDVFFPVSFAGSELNIGQAYNTSTDSVRSGKIDHRGRVFLFDE